uniref:Uncharacterized protein n=1 Tax=Solanum tuberosum TaxID=4113 RepID=M1DE04_SOLTU
MSPKAKNVVGSKQSRKGEASESSSGHEPVQKFGKKVVERYGWEWFECQREAKYMGDELVNEEPRIVTHDEFNNLKDKPPYRDSRHTLCGVDSTARWERINRGDNIYVVLVYMLMKGVPINVGAILRQNMMKFRNNLRWKFCYGGLITRFLWAEKIDEETVDITVAYHQYLTGKFVDLTRTKALDTSHGKNVWDGSVMVRMFGMAELQLRIGGHPVTDSEMESMAERYPLTESAAFLCRTGPVILEPLDDEEATVD